MVVMPRRWPWLALLVAFGWALRVHRHADSALTFWSDLPAWVFNFIVLPAVLIMIAPWIVRP